MNSKIVLSITLVLLMIGGAASMTTYSAAGGGLAVNDPVLGSYTYNLSSEGLVSDIVFSTNQNSTLLVNSVFINGSSTLNISASGTQIATQAGLDKVSINNATMYTQSQLNGLAFVSYSNISGAFPPIVTHPNMTFNLNNGLTEMNLVSNSSLDGPFGDYLEQDLLLQLDENWSLYKIDNSVYNGYFFTNGNATLSNGNTTIHVEGVSNRVSLTNVEFSILVSGFISSGDFLHLMNNYMYQHQNYHKFTYNPGTGLVSGQYLSFTFNEHTGAITNLVSKLPTSSQVFSSITASGNGNMGTSFFLPYLPMDQVKLFGSIFFFANSSFVYGIHNNPALQMNMVLNNGTMQFELPAGMNVTTVTLPFGSNSGFNLTPLRYDVNQYQQFGLGTTNQVMAGGYTMMIYNSNVRGFLTVTGGNATYNATTGTISVSTAGLGMVNFVMPPGLNEIPSGTFQDLKYAYQHGNLAGQISCDYLNGTPLNYSFLYNNSLDFKFLGESPGQVHFQASSGISQGTNLAFFVNKTYLNSSSNVYLYVNGEAATLSNNVGSVLNSTGSTPSYAVVATQSGYMVLLHIPHFTSYNITISGDSIGGGGGPLIPAWGIAVIAVVAIAVIALVVYLLLVRRK